MKFKVFRSIRFKLTLWYSLLVFFFAVGFVFSLNIIVTNYYTQIPPSTVFIDRNAPVAVQKRWIDLAKEEQQRILQIRRADLYQIQRISTLTLIPLAVLSFAGGYFLSGRMLKPISDINKATKEINAKNLNLKINDPETEDELGELIRNFNDMIERLQESFIMQKQFVENASHEIKTPLAIVKTNLETIISSDSSENSNETINRIKRAISSIDFMNNLVEDLLLLSYKNNKSTYNPVDIKELILSILSELKPFADAKNIELELTSQQSLIVMANKYYLARAFGNVIENAIKYSKTDSKISLDMEKLNNKVLIKVNDTGPGIPKEQVEKVFERFYRVDKSRSRKEGGSGLGLAITRKILSEHNSKIYVDKTSQEGTTFIIEIPIYRMNS